MENFLISIVYSITFFISLKYILTHHKDIFKQEQERNIPELEEQIHCLNIKIKKHSDLIKKIADKIPFTGEDWQQEIVQEKLDKLFTDGTYDILDGKAVNNNIIERFDN